MKRIDATVWLILPTYNEVQNIGPFVAAAVQRLNEAATKHVLLIVDDNSPDGTGKAADLLAKTYDSVRVLHRQNKQGLGRAYLAGFDVALENDAEYIMEMDADFSHDPRDIPRLVQAASEGDIAIGSRYTTGGGVRDWGAGRRVLSRAGCWYARKWLRIEVKDLTGGFKCFSREALIAIEPNKVVSNGYGFQIEMTYRALRAGLQITEVPIWFTERRVGESKMSPRIAIEAVLRVPTLKRQVDRDVAANPTTSRTPDRSEIAN